MYEDIKELIDLAAPAPNMAHCEELWEQFLLAAQGTAEAVVVLRPALQSAEHSDTLTLQRVEPIDELARRRNRRRVSSVFVLAAAIVTVAGIVAVSRKSNTVQVSVPPPESSAAPPTIIFYNFHEGGLWARGGWNGKSVVRVPLSVEPGRYQTLSGTEFVYTGDPYANDIAGVNPLMNPMMFLSDTSWPVQPRPVRAPVTNLQELEDARFDIYREEARRLAKDFGGADVLPDLFQVERGDLDGDGTEEVLVSASYSDFRRAGVVGRYSIAYVRHVVGDHAVSKVLGVAVSSKLLGDFRIQGASDIDGDGVMEVIAKNDSDEIFVWDAGSADKAPKRLFKLGDGDLGS